MDWCITWQSSVNIDKCKYMTIGGTSNRQYSVRTDYVSIIQHSTKESDLGVTFITDFKFPCHINAVICTASKMIGIIYRTFRMLTPHTLRLLYTSLVRPHLDYACVVWQPYFLKDIRALEAVQRRATRLLPTVTYLF